MYWRLPCKSSITEARQRIGSGVITRLFHLVVRPLATIETPEAFLLAMEYHKRWEVENTIDELKVHLLGRQTPIRSLNQE